MRKAEFRIYINYKSPTLKLSAMKNYPIVILLLFHITLTAGNMPTSKSFLDTKVSVTKTESDLGLIQATEISLVNHIWELDAQTFLFNKQGVVSQIKDGRHCHTQWWEVYAENGQAYLKLYNKSSETTYQIVEEQNAWVLLATNETVAIKATPIKDAKLLSAALRSLVGTWSSRMYPSALIQDLEMTSGKSIASIDFQYKVQSDGTFQKRLYLNEQLHQEMDGVWQLSTDGDYLILHFDKGDKSFQTYIVEVKHLSLDELVIDQALVTSDLESNICKEMETFFFNKR